MTGLETPFISTAVDLGSRSRLNSVSSKMSADANSRPVSRNTKQISDINSNSSSDKFRNDSLSSSGNEQPKRGYNQACKYCIQ